MLDSLNKGMLYYLKREAEKKVEFHSHLSTIAWLVVDIEASLKTFYVAGCADMEWIVYDYSFFLRECKERVK